MSNRQFRQTGQIDETLNRLSRQLSNEPLDSPESVIQRSLDEIASVEPFTAAALLSGEIVGGESVWTHVHSMKADRALFDQLVADRPDLLDDLQRTQEPVQHDLSDLISHPVTEKRRYFIGLPAGLVDDELSSIWLLSEREVSQAELDRLVSFSRMLGLAAENARLAGMLTPGHGRSPVANLIGLIAHELRTPLTGMRGNIQLALMSNQKGQTERVPERLQAAIGVVDNMTSLVQKLLDVSRLERGNFPFSPARANLRGTASAAIEATLAESDPATELIRLDEGNPVEHEHDQQALQDALAHLLTTALKYRETDGPIVVQVLARQDANLIDISYHGSPFSVTDQVALAFPLYERQPNISSNYTQDLSLELAYARGVVRHHDGAITLHTSENDDTEQLISVRLPVGALN